MNTNYRKKKQPLVIRANLLEATAEVLVERGLAGLTLDLVAKRAGVSKGGLIHHFPTKQALLEGLNQEILAEYEKFIDDNMAADPEPRGRFIRSYIRSFFSALKYKNAAKLFNVFVFEMSHNESLQKKCGHWYERIAAKYGERNLSLKGQMIQFAADGLWVEECTGMVSVTPEQRRDLIDYLIQQTYEL